MSAEAKAARIARSLSQADCQRSADDGEWFYETADEITQALLDDGAYEAVPATDLSDIARDSLWDEITRRGITFA